MGLLVGLLSWRLISWRGFVSFEGYVGVTSDRRIWERSAQQCMERKYLKRKEITFYVGLVHGVG